MKKRVLFILLTVLCVFMLSACEEVGPQGEKGDKGEQGEQGIQGIQGESGVDGISPQLRINETTNMWEISYDNGTTWTSLDVPATGEKGDNGVGITNIEFNSNGNLIIKFSDGSSLNVGKVPECEHDYEDWKFQITESCLSMGCMSRICKICEYTDYKFTPSKGHVSVTDVAVLPTCTEDGLTEGSHCEVCKVVLKTQDILPKTEHLYNYTVVSEATCVSDGVKRYDCLNCDDFYTENFKMQSYTATELFKLISNSVAEIITYDKEGDSLSLGTGFVYSSDGKIVTNYHVIENSCSAEISVNGRTYVVQNVLAYDVDKDLAVLKINATNLPVTPICTEKIKTGSIVYAYGSSRGLTDTFSNGIVTQCDREVNGVKYIQHNAAISSGNSGGPLLNEYCEIIGINTAYIIDSQNINLAIPVYELDNLVYDNPMTLREVFEEEYIDPFLMVKFLLILDGYYNSTYEWYLDSTVSYLPDCVTRVTLEVIYASKYDEIWLRYWIGDDEVVVVTIDEIDGSYEWSYYDNSLDYNIHGNLSSYYYDYCTLIHSSTNITNSTVLLNRCEKASAMITKLLQQFYYYGITANDLGFINF